MTQKQILAVLQCSMMQNVNKREGSVTFCYTKLIKFYLVKKLDWLEDFLQEVSVNFFFSSLLFADNKQKSLGKLFCEGILFVITKRN